MQTVESLLTAAYIYLDTPDDITGLAEALETIDLESMDSGNASEAYQNLYSKILELAGPEISQTCLQNGNTAYKGWRL